MDDTLPLSKEDLKILLDRAYGPLGEKLASSSFLLLAYRRSKLSILVHAGQLRAQKRESYDLIPAKARLDAGDGYSVELDCFVAYGYWERLPSDEEIDVLDHLPQLFPKAPDRESIGVFTCQNGIQNTLEDFEDMCNSVIAQLQQEKPLFIGLYNPTSRKWWGMPQDLDRLRNEPMFNVDAFMFARQMFMTLGQRVSAINPMLLWAHIAHSEGGLITRDCLMNKEWGLPEKEERTIQKHLITMIYGGVASIPSDQAFQTLNTYSNRDIALHFVRRYLDKVPLLRENNDSEKLDKAWAEVPKAWKDLIGDEPLQQVKNVREDFCSSHYISSYPHHSSKEGYEINVVDCITKSPPIPQGDHTFTDDTYQQALYENLEQFRNRRMIYHAN